MLMLYFRMRRRGKNDSWFLRGVLGNDAQAGLVSSIWVLNPLSVSWQRINLPAGFQNNDGLRSRRDQASCTDPLAFAAQLLYSVSPSR